MSAEQIEPSNTGKGKTYDERERIIKEIRIEQFSIKLIEILILAFVILGEYYVFKKCITELNLSNTISLGAIFATFGSALITIFFVIEENKHARFATNIEILFNDILYQKPWKRWEFLGRTTHIKNLDNTTITTVLKNPKLPFDVGSYVIEIYIPTVRQDFYDLPAFKCYWEMRKNRKHFKTNLHRNKDRIMENSPFKSIGEYSMGWDCVYDTWETIILYKISRIILKAGATIVFVSFFYSFAFIYVAGMIL